MDNTIQANLSEYLELYNEIRGKVHGEDRVALTLLQEVTKDRRMEQIREERELKTGEPATTKQLEYLKALNVEVVPGITKKQASILIDNALYELNKE